MAIRVVRLGSDREPGEGVRLGTVRRPPRGVRKADHARRNFYDVWLPALAPSDALLRESLHRKVTPEDDERAWRQFARRYRKEMAQPEARHLLDLLAALSHASHFSVGCYCENEARCHRSVLGSLLAARGADMHASS